MGRKPKPWWDERDEVWRVTIRGMRYNLGSHKKSAETEFHRLMGDGSRQAISSVATVLDEFLTWCYENRAKRTADRYHDFLQSLLDDIDDMPIERLTTADITRWLSRRPAWNPTTKRNAITAVCRALNWGTRSLGTPNPIAGIEKPTPVRRTTAVTPAEFEGIVAVLPIEDPFRDLLIVSFDSGCRPHEAKVLEARHVDLLKCRAILSSSEAKKGVQRAIYFPTTRSMEIVSRLIASRPTGPLLVNSRGRRWTASSVKLRFQRLHEAGLTPRRYTHYEMRHSFITRQLVAGVDSHVVARLAGHQSTEMLDRHYSHIADDYRFMLDQSRRGCGDGEAPDEVEQHSPEHETGNP